MGMICKYCAIDNDVPLDARIIINQIHAHSFHFVGKFNYSANRFYFFFLGLVVEIIITKHPKDAQATILKSWHKMRWLSQQWIAACYDYFIYWIF